MTLSDIAQEWLERLGKYDLQTLKKALDHCQEHEEHPPSLPKFVSLCEANRPHDYVAALPHKLTEEEIARNRQMIQDATEQFQNSRRTDFKAWAKRILANPKHYPDLSVKYAREALAMPDVEIA